MIYQLDQHEFFEFDLAPDGDPFALVGALALWQQANSESRESLEESLQQLVAGRPDGAIAAELAEDLPLVLPPPEPWCEGCDLGEWLERIECLDLAAEAAQLREFGEVAAMLRSLAQAGVDSLGRLDLVILGDLISRACQSAQRQTRQPWAAILAQGPRGLPEPSDARVATAVIDAWALGRLEPSHEAQLCQHVASDGPWRDAYRATLGSFAYLQWRQTFATAERVLGQEFLPHLGRGAAARFVATRTRLLLRWPGHPDEAMVEGANFWGDSVTGALRTDVRLLASDVHLALQEVLLLLQDQGTDDVQLLGQAAQLLADERLEGPLGQAAEMYREGALDDSGQVEWQVWQIAQVRTELELAARRVDSAELRQALTAADSCLRKWQADEAFCLLSTEQLEELAEALGGNGGQWWLRALELEDFVVPSDSEIWERRPVPAPTLPSVPAPTRRWFALDTSPGHMADAEEFELKLAWKGPGEDDARLNAPPKAYEDQCLVLQLWSERTVAAIELGEVRIAVQSTGQNRWAAELNYGQLLAAQAQGGLDKGLGVEVDGCVELWTLDPDSCVGIE